MGRSLGRIVLLCLFGAVCSLGGLMLGLNRGIDIGIQLGVDETLKLIEPMLFFDFCVPGTPV